jgi:predicted metal-dependent hydrolase
MSEVTRLKALRFDTGPRTGELVPLDKPKVTFGRKESSDCVLLHATVSREHFFIELNDRKYFVVDCGSGNGTLVNGERVTWAELKSGDRVQAGPFAFTVELDQPGDLVARKAPKESAADEALAGASADAGDENIPNTFSPWQHIYPREYLEGIAHFNAGRYYDAHEIWEELWLRSSGDKKLFLQMLIQAAVALHHYQRANLKGARNLYEAVIDKLKRFDAEFMDVDLAIFSASFHSCLNALVAESDETTLPPLTTRPQIRLLSGGAIKSETFSS